jgi:hypothetical protein
MVGGILKSQQQQHNGEDSTLDEFKAFINIA